MYPMQSFLQMMEDRIRRLEDRALLAERELQIVKESFAQIRPVQIGAVHYKVQELTVSELSGTLNVGLTALSDPSQLESLINKNGEETSENKVTFQHLQNETEVEP